MHKNIQLFIDNFKYKYIDYFAKCQFVIILLTYIPTTYFVICTFVIRIETSKIARKLNKGC